MKDVVSEETLQQIMIELDSMDKKIDHLEAQMDEKFNEVRKTISGGNK